MIIQICDICGKEVKNLDTIVLYKQPIEYCEKCQKKIETVAIMFKNELKVQNQIMSIALKNTERKMIKELMKGKRKNGNAKKI